MPALRVCMKERNAYESRSLEGGAKPHRKVAALDLPHRVMANAGPFGKLFDRPATLKARQTHLRAEQARSFNDLR